MLSVSSGLRKVAFACRRSGGGICVKTFWRWKVSESHSTRGPCATSFAEQIVGIHKYISRLEANMRDKPTKLSMQSHNSCLIRPQPRRSWMYCGKSITTLDLSMCDTEWPRMRTQEKTSLVHIDKYIKKDMEHVQTVQTDSARSYEPQSKHSPKTTQTRKNETSWNEKHAFPGHPL